MGNKLWLMQHDELKKGGIISMFIHLFKEMCGFVSMCVCVCVCAAHLPIHTPSPPPSSHLLDVSSASVCVCVCVVHVSICSCCRADIPVCLTV